MRLTLVKCLQKVKLIKKMGELRDQQDWVTHYRDGFYYTIYPGDECILEPRSKAKGNENFRGRRCVIVCPSMRADRVIIRYLESGTLGRRSINDLIPVLCDKRHKRSYLC